MGGGSGGEEERRSLKYIHSLLMKVQAVELAGWGNSNEALKFESLIAQDRIFFFTCKEVRPGSLSSRGGRSGSVQVGCWVENSA